MDKYNAERIAVILETSDAAQTELEQINEKAKVLVKKLLLNKDIQSIGCLFDYAV